MKKYPQNMPDFINMFPTNEACLEYIAQIRWPNGYQCEACNGQDIWEMSRGLYRCKACRYDSSVIAGTLFHGSHKPLTTWFQAIWYVVNQKNGVSALGLQQALGLGSYHTSWKWLHKLRRAMVRIGRDKLSGLVEVNETFIGGARHGKRGRGADNKSLVLIAVEDNENKIGRIRLSVIEDDSSTSITPAVVNMVEKGSSIRTDGWNGYAGLRKNGYKHLPITNENIAEEDVISLAHLLASLLKRWLLGTHQGAIDHKNLPYYLDEFTFRFNRRTSRSRGKLFYRLVQQAIEIGPVPGKTLNTTYSG